MQDAVTTAPDADPTDDAAPTVKCADAKLRRDELTEKKLCLNGASHGPATHGRRCAWCREVHRRGVAAVLADPNAPPRPQGYLYRGPREAVTPEM